MALTLIEISDYYLTLTQDEQQYRQLGSCLVENDKVLFGESAWQQQLLVPQQSYGNYWQQLGYEKIYSDNGAVEHFADLAYLQLKEAVSHFDSVEDVVILVSGHYNCEQLALLLGIVNACELTIVRLINNAVAQMTSLLSSKPSNRKKLTEALYLDIDLHQVSVSELAINGEVKLSQFQSFHQKGLIDLVKHLAVWMNECFILEYRFDVFDCAHTEQSLFNQITCLLPESQANYQIIIHDSIIEDQVVNSAAETNGALPRGNKVTVQDNSAAVLIDSTMNDLPVSDKVIVITEQQLQQQIQLFFSDIFDELIDKKQIVMSAKIAKFIAHTNMPTTWQVISESMVYPFLKQHLDKEVQPEKIELVSHLVLPPMEGGNPSTNGQSPLSNQIQASHLVYQGEVCLLQQPITHLPLQESISQQARVKSAVTLKKSQLQWFIQLNEHTSVFVNNKPAVEGQLLAIGDQIKLSETADNYLLAVLKGSDEFYGV